MTDTPLAAFLEIAATYPDRDALVHAGRRESFDKLSRRAAALARMFSADGVERGRHVLIPASNGIATAAAIPAIWSLGAIPAFLSPNTREERRIAVEALFDPAVILSNDYLATGPEPGETSLERGVGRVPEEIGSIMFTSGSSGLPKGVQQKATTLLDGARRVAAYQGYAEEERILCPVPWSHDYGWGQLLSCLTLGKTLILPENASMAAACEAIGAERPSLIAGVPSFFAGMLFGVSDIGRTEIGSVRRLTSTGSRFSVDLLDAVRETFPKAQAFLNYGLTETFRTACLTPELQAETTEGIGRAIPGIRVAAFSAEGELLPVEEEGELAHFGPGTFHSYLANPERSAAVRRRLGPNPLGLPEETLGVATGDLGAVDGAGRIHLTGRMDRQIKSLDVGVNLDEVEAALHGSGLLDSVAVISRPHRLLGNKIVAYCVPKPGTETRTVKRFAKREMSKYLQPRDFVFAEALPLTAAGKIDYPALSRPDR
ncbi:class I adenylate-forming enzyme family protein [Tropicimonas sp. TH_r6]|uniref:class I adenylate-forming enzyme family protein n=1 Tax=Tropicimonas sp. TH_r6 TaxID=3082085 RepID=UPI002952D72A|nr:class I adenylate-forming enzyme family protein [Tropicimonas sp. TH_r6]MDV7141314.1 class I adenylate-forming enzyme family protein [Tropicimonas sp. TH_r6]